MRHLRKIKAADFESLEGESDYERALLAGLVYVLRYEPQKGAALVLVDAPDSYDGLGTRTEEEPLPAAAREELARYRESFTWL